MKPLELPRVVVSGCSDPYGGHEKSFSTYSKYIVEWVSGCVERFQTTFGLHEFVFVGISRLPKISGLVHSQFLPKLVWSPPSPKIGVLPSLPVWEILGTFRFRDFVQRRWVSDNYDLTQRDICRQNRPFSSFITYLDFFVTIL